MLKVTSAHCLLRFGGCCKRPATCCRIFSILRGIRPFSSGLDSTYEREVSFAEAKETCSRTHCSRVAQWRSQHAPRMVADYATRLCHRLPCVQAEVQPPQEQAILRMSPAAASRASSLTSYVWIGSFIVLRFVVSSAVFYGSSLHQRCADGRLPGHAISART